MRHIGDYAMQAETFLGFDDAIAAATEFLRGEGFGILTEIDVTETLRQKLGVEFKPFRILGACNPSFAHRALEAVPHVSVLLPCNVVVWDDGDRRVVAAMEPTVMSKIVDHPEVKLIAAEVSARLQRVIQRIEEMPAGG